MTGIGDLAALVRAILAKVPSAIIGTSVARTVGGEAFPATEDVS